MQMTNSEICASYRYAKDKKKQVNILSQLNDCPKDMIISILKGSGYKPDQTGRRAEKKDGNEKGRDVSRSETRTPHQSAAPTASPEGEAFERGALEFNGIEAEIVTLALTELRRTTIEKKAKIEKQIEALDILLDKCFASKNGETEEKNHGSM